MSQVEELRTPRLTLSRIGVQHFDEVRLLHCDEMVMATLGGVRTIEQTRAGIEALEHHWSAHGFGPWVARDTSSGEFVGMGGLREVLIEGVTETEIGYALTPTWWGRGLATELARASAHVAFDLLQVPALVCFSLPTNTRSRRVMEKVGFRYERDFVYKVHPQVLYRLTRAMWNEFHGPSRSAIVSRA